MIEKKRLMYKKYKDSGILRAFWDVELNDYKGDQEALACSKKYVNKFDAAYKNGIGMYLHGGFGTGKTMLVNCILKNAIHTGRYSVHFTTLSELMGKFEDRFSPASKSFINKIKNVSFLGIDDIGKEYRNDSGFVEAKFNDVIRYRNMSNYPTLLTSNKAPDELKEYGQSIYSIIKGFCVVVYVKGRDYRIEHISREIDNIINSEE